MTSVLKRPDNRFNAPAAIHVITGEDIRRSGVRNFPEALRLAPGMNIAQIDAGQWAIGSRGFSGVFANKLLGLVDGLRLARSLKPRAITVDSGAKRGDVRVAQADDDRAAEFGKSVEERCRAGQTDGSGAGDEHGADRCSAGGRLHWERTHGDGLLPTQHRSGRR